MENSKKTVSKNILANAVGKIWTVLVSLVFVPVYIKLLGEEAYGIVTFFAVMQSVLNIMGMGLQKTLRREFAAQTKDIEYDNQNKYRMLRSTELVYFIIFLIITSICFVFSDYISTRWLNYDTLDSNMVSDTITLMGVSIGLQLIANLYAGGIYGLDYQGTANLLQIIWSTIKNAGVILVLLFINNTLIWFYLWFILFDFLYAVVLRVVLIRLIPVSTGHSWRLSHISNLKKIWKYALGLLFISIGSALNTQLDKIIMSRYLPIISVGAYNSAVHLGSFTSYVPGIIGTAIFSNIATMVFQNKIEEAKNLFLKLNRISIITVSSISAYIALFSYEIILIWTQSPEYAEIMKFAAPLVIVGYTLNAFQQIAYDYLLASGNTKINTIQLWCCIPYVLIVTVILTRKYGVNGAATAWVIELLISTIIYLYYFYKVSFNQSGYKWLAKDVFGIYLLALIPAVILRIITTHFGFSSIAILLVAILFGLITLLVLLLVFEKQFLKDSFCQVVSILKKD